MSLFVEHGATNFGDLAVAELLDAAQRMAGVGDIVGNQNSGMRHVDEIGGRRKNARNLETLIDAGVELDVHRVHVLY